MIDRSIHGDYELDRNLYLIDLTYLAAIQSELHTSLSAIL